MEGEGNASMAALRIYHARTPVRAPDTIEPLDYTDAPCAGGEFEVALPLTLAVGEYVSLVAYPYTGWDGAAPIGAPGRPRREQASRLDGGASGKVFGDAFRIADFVAEDEGEDSVTYAGTAGVAVAEVWWGLLTLPFPYRVDVGEEVAADPYAAVRAAGLLPMAIPADRRVRITVQHPPDRHRAYLIVEPSFYGADGRRSAAPGGVIQIEVAPPPAEPPLVRLLGTLETAETATVRFSVAERGIAVEAVEVVTRVGKTPPSEWAPPTRGPGAAAAILTGYLGEDLGAVLGAGEYEADVARAGTRTSTITPGITAAGKRFTPLGTLVFDRGVAPTFVDVRVEGTIVSVVADANDTRSLSLEHRGGDWRVDVDGMSTQVDVSKPGTNEEPGMGAGDRWTLDVWALAEPRVLVSASTARARREVTVAGGSAPAVAQWENPYPQADAPPWNSSTISLTLQAAGSVAGVEVRVFDRYQMNDGAWSAEPGAEPEVTSSLSPALSAAPSAATAYALPTPHIAREPETLGGEMLIGDVVTHALRCELVDTATDAVLDTWTEIVGWPV